MKKKYIYTIITIMFLFIIVMSIYILNKKMTSFIINDIKKSLVIIIPEKRLVSFKENPGGILGFDIESGIGMGFFINNDGKILTVNHIINNKNIDYIVKTYDNKEYQVKIISNDKENDLAVLKIESNIEYNMLNFSKNYGEIKIGDDIISFGVNIDKLNASYLKGKITNISKKLDNLSDLIEFSGVIKNGFSGGPIININGEVIGINSSIYDGKSYGIKLPSVFLQ